MALICKRLTCGERVSAMFHFVLFFFQVSIVLCSGAGVWCVFLGEKQMNKLVMAVLLMSVCGSSLAIDKVKFTQIVNDTIKIVLSGSVTDVDALLAKQQELVDIGAQGCLDYAATHPDDAAFLQAIVDQKDVMSKLSLDDIEEQWHDYGYLKSKGFDPDKYEHFAPVISLMDTVVHPATAIIALNLYKNEKDADHLEQVKDELSEVLEHLKYVK